MESHHFHHVAPLSSSTCPSRVCNTPNTQTQNPCNYTPRRLLFTMFKFNFLTFIINFFILITTIGCQSTTMSQINLRLPSPYTPPNTPSQSFSPPTLSFLSRTWSITHSSLSMWRNARNVRITYSPLPSPSTNKISDLVEYESKSPTFLTSGVNRIRGIDTLSQNTGSWDWRGSGFLFFVTSHWEILGWGQDEETGEKWIVTWFQKTVFSAEGIDVYSDRKEGMSEGLRERVLGGVKGLEENLGRLVGEDLMEVEIRLPWLE
ncbi:hypothetical protein QBC38DRAFT_484173 [Podospora fimiseda]|uniref:Uncharacterized protein n=1 Tax=Podospora fimiseda TaxID=252190 RepID=A0AAN7GY84_9PEZI|nr:hypothetical protein QBC38DRAFT_484173 [Podospora fimiseda]